MKTAAVAIGVDKTGGLTPLGGAASGAEDFAQWAEGQGMDVERLLDTDGTVTLDRVVDVIESIVTARTYEKLIVFFAGHGFLTGPQSELWLLSRAPDRAHEAINVELSRSNARYCGIPHVIFVSDACRSGGPNHRHRSVSGGSAFPTPANYQQTSEVDTFYATRPGDPANEFRDDAEATGNYRGILTECLLLALEGDVPEAVAEIAEGDEKRWIIPSRQLKASLAREVPLRAAEISIKLQQQPEVRVESAPPSCFGELRTRPNATRSASGGPSTEPAPDLRALVEQASVRTMTFAEHVPDGPLTATNEVAAGFNADVDRVLRARGRESFETACGFTVYDAVRSAVAGNGVHCDLWNEGDVSHIRVHDAHDHVPSSILIELQGGTGAVLAVKPEFIGTVLVDAGRIVNVNYTPSRTSPLYSEEYAPEAERIERRRAFAATAARHGVFEVSGSEADASAAYLRMLKRMDPTLGVYAAYAYHSSGRIDAVRDVLRWMKNDPPPVPFDVALLSRESDWPPVAPFCPLLNQGWSLLELHPSAARNLRELRAHLLPALWTTLTAEGVAWTRERLERGDLS